MHPLITLTTILLTAVVFSIAGLFNAIFAKTFDDISIIPTFVLTPLTYLGGVFFSIQLLPPFWQKVALANPILYMVNAFRYGMLGSSDIPIWRGVRDHDWFRRRSVRGRARDAAPRQRRESVTCAAGSGCSRAQLADGKRQPYFVRASSEVDAGRSGAAVSDHAMRTRA